MSADFDFSDLTKLADQFTHVVDELPRGAVPAMEHAAYTTKEAWRESLNRSEFPASGAAIQYEVAGDGESVTATVESSQGTPRMQGFVEAREYGSPTVPPAGDARVALALGADDLARGAAIAGKNAIERALNS